MPKIYDNHALDQIQDYGIDIQTRTIYLFGREDYISVTEGEEPGVDFAMANRFIKNLQILQQLSSDPIIIMLKSCLSRKTPITTPEGRKPIKDIEVGDLVLTHKGRYKPVIEKMSKKYSGEMVKIYYGTTPSDKTSFRATSDHPVLVERKGHRSWIPIKDVVKGDLIFVESSRCEETGFVKVKVTGKESWWNKYTQTVYNLAVEEDNSFVANKVVVHNCGGDWLEGISIYQSILACPNHVTMINHASARSMSSLIFLAADKRVMMPYSQYMIHKGTEAFEGTVTQFYTEFEQLKIADNQMLDIYVEALKGSERFRGDKDRKIKNWVVSRMKQKEEVYFTAEEAVELNFADEIFDYNWSKIYG